MATGRPGRLRKGRGLNGAGNDEDGGQQDLKCSKKTNTFYYDVGWKRVDGHGHDVVPVGKAEGDLSQNHQTTERLCAEMEELILAQNSPFVSLACEV